jgi:hypothetical protein
VVLPHIQPIKKVVNGQLFRPDKDIKDIKATVVLQLQKQLKKFFPDKIYQVVHQWEASLQAHGNLPLNESENTVNQ